MSFESSGNITTRSTSSAESFALAMSKLKLSSGALPTSTTLIDAAAGFAISCEPVSPIADVDAGISSFFGVEGVWTLPSMG